VVNMSSLSGKPLDWSDARTSLEIGAGSWGAVVSGPFIPCAVVWASNQFLFLKVSACRFC